MCVGRNTNIYLCAYNDKRRLGDTDMSIIWLKGTTERNKPKQTK